MNILIIHSFLSGLFFGAWPILMSKSGLSGPLAAAVFGICSLALVLPVALYSGIETLSSANWIYIALAGVCGAFGMLFFTNMLSKSTPENIALHFIICLMVQSSVPVVYHIYQNGLSKEKAVGFAISLLGLYILNR